MSGVPNVFGSATSSIPLSQLDVNFNTPVTIGNTTVGLGNTVTSFGNVTLTNTTVTVGNVTTDLTVHGLTVGQGGGSVSTNTAVGAQALNATATGGGNTGVGYQADASITTGTSNSAFGQFALTSNSTGGSNTGIGAQALNSNTASNNTAVGYQAGYTNSTGLYGTFVGWKAGYGSTGDENTFIGSQAGTVSTGTFNTFVGDTSGYLMTTGSKNTILGRFSGNQGGLNILGLNNYIVLSDGDGNPRMNFDGSGNLTVGTFNGGDVRTNGGFQYVIGASSFADYGHGSSATSGSSYFRFWYNASQIGSITQNGTTGVLYNLTSDYRLKNEQQALTGAKDFIMALKPKKWQWWDGSGEGVGFVAHEFMEVAKYSGHGEKDAVDADGKPVYQSIQPSSSEVMANLVSFIQEQQAMITTLQTQVTALQAKVGV